MKEAFWGYFLIALGLIIITVLLLVNRLTTTNEEGFYLGREVLEASMIDAVDYGTYRTTGRLVMSKQKFVEAFIRRFSESVTNNKTYKLEFYDIYEEPPKASVRIRTTSGSTAVKDDSFELTLDTNLNGILETIYGKTDTGPTSSGDNSVNYDDIRYVGRDGGENYSDPELRFINTSIPCGTALIINSSDIAGACKYGTGTTDNAKFCKVVYGGKTVYVRRGDLRTGQPICD
ncbi:MAG: hypothetical protein GX758_03510 [Tenericutes bacterium]|nr:hypothetical protein [Mycoplasmatota bacterium]